MGIGRDLHSKNCTASVVDANLRSPSSRGEQSDMVAREKSSAHLFLLLISRQTDRAIRAIKPTPETGKQSESHAPPPFGEESRITNNENRVPALLRHLSIRASFVICHSCFVIAFSSPTYHSGKPGWAILPSCTGFCRPRRSCACRWRCTTSSTSPRRCGSPNS